MESRITDLAIRLGAVALFAYLSLTLVAPFAIIMIWAIILAVALYPPYAALRRILGGRGVPAAMLITLVGLAIIIGPFGAFTLNFAAAAQDLITRLGDGTVIVPIPSDEVRDWPIIGERVHSAWSVASGSLEAALRQFGPALLQAGGAVLGRIAGIGFGLLGFAVSMLIAGILLGPGPRLAEGVKAIVGRISAQRGTHFVDLAGATIRNISRGVIGVALLQALLAGLVLTVFDVPGAGVIAFIVLMLCIVQVGPILMLLPVIIWAWMTMDPGPALILTLLLVPIAVIDNVLKPILMARGLSTPMLVILVGVIGGTLSYGLIGLFLGPVVLGVTYELLMAWVVVKPPVQDVVIQA